MSGQLPSSGVVSDKTNVVSGDQVNATVTWNDPDNRELTFTFPGVDGQGNQTDAILTLVSHDDLTYPNQVACNEDPSVVAVKQSQVGNQVFYKIQIP
jgi:hypothetical protein